MKSVAVGGSWCMLAAWMLCPGLVLAQETSFGILIEPSGDSFLQNFGALPVQINGYQISDSLEPGRLDVNRWFPISAFAKEQPDVVREALGETALDFNVVNVGPAQLTELTLTAGGEWEAGERWWIGQPFGPGPFDGPAIQETLKKFGFSFNSPVLMPDLLVLRFIVPGDANWNGFVGLEDFVVLKANFGMTGASFSGGDFNGDAVVNLDDFTLLKHNFGSNTQVVVSTGEDEGTATAACEPASAVLMLLGGLAAWRSRKGGRHGRRAAAAARAACCARRAP